jgi:hypothetical protein
MIKRLMVVAALSLAACLPSGSDPAGPASGPAPIPDPGTHPSDPVQPPQEGGGSDTETLTGFVNGADGSPLAGVPVKLLPADYDPSHPDPFQIRRVLTDTAGKFRFEKVDTAQLWNVIAGDPARQAWALAQGLRPGPAAAPLALSLGKVFLFSMHATQYGARDSGIAYFPGTDILTHCDGSTPSLVDSVPEGASRFVIESRAGWKYDTTVAVPKDTTRVSADRTRLFVLP